MNKIISCCLIGITALFISDSKCIAAKDVEARKVSITSFRDLLNEAAFAAYSIRATKTFQDATGEVEGDAASGKGEVALTNVTVWYFEIKRAGEKLTDKEKELLKNIANEKPPSPLGRISPGGLLLYDKDKKPFAYVSAFYGNEGVITAGPPFLIDEKSWQASLDPDGWLLATCDKKLCDYLLRLIEGLSGEKPAGKEK